VGYPHAVDVGGPVGFKGRDIVASASGIVEDERFSGKKGHGRDYTVLPAWTQELRAPRGRIRNAFLERKENLWYHLPV
jgi:hypothetical protein